jgi:Arc/MetJ-type ribon-helix-helix transcriptional regulator
MPDITVTIPDILNKHLEHLVESGFAKNREVVLTEALKRYLESHSDEIIREQVMRDVKWGLSE